MGNIIELFYSQEYEKKINKQMLNYAYVFPSKEVIDYVNQVVSEPIDSFIKHIETCEKDIIQAKDVFQFSNIDDATIAYCQKLKENQDPGMKYLEIGKMLLDDGKERKDGAYLKYGENHAKTAAMLGLSYEICKTYFLSCLGMVYPELDEDTRDKLIVRLILRNKLIIRLWQASQNGNVNVREFLYMLSDATYVRRRSNVKKIVEFLNDEDTDKMKTFLGNLNF